MAAKPPRQSKNDSLASLAPSTRERLLDVAAAHFAESGFRRTSVARVARALDITPPAVYFHFAGKEELFIAAFDRQATHLSDEVIGADPDDVGPDFWATALPSILAHLPDHPLVHRVTRGAEPTLMPRLAAGELPNRFRAALGVSLRKAQQAGMIRNDLDCDTTATGIEAVLLALLLTVVQSGGTGFDERSGPVRALLWSALEPR